MKRNGWIGLGAALVIAGGGTAFLLRGSRDDIKWRTAKVDRGNITARISATGTLNALIQVPVGTQVSGVVTGLFADFSSIVKKGQVIGKIDETPWITNLHQAEAALQNAKSSLAYAQLDYKRNKRLWEEKLIADSDLDAKDLALKTAQGNLDEAKAALETAKTNLGYCTLKAPVDGVVVARLVDVGQTVAASFATPSVFSIAQDLSRMKVQAAIDEADIGQVKVGQKAFFTVDSYPDKQFHGQVSEVQLNPIINQNVVTYNVMMAVDNEPRFTASAPPEKGAGEGRRGGALGAQPASWRESRGDAGRAARAARHGAAAGATQARGGQADLERDTARYIPEGSPVYKGDLALFPGMTANCAIVTKVVQQVLRVPSSALRFNPATFLKGAESKASSAPQAGGVQKAGAASGKGLVARREDRVWTLGPDGKPRMLPVRAGATDGMFTEISGDGVTEGLVVLTGVEDLKKQAQSGASSPLGGPGMRR